MYICVGITKYTYNYIITKYKCITTYSVTHALTGRKQLKSSLLLLLASSAADLTGYKTTQSFTLSSPSSDHSPIPSPPSLPSPSPPSLPSHSPGVQHTLHHVSDNSNTSCVPLSYTPRTCNLDDPVPISSPGT